ncbi:MAG: saccharopine dehydrogenase NADP-binding domain-containing protein [Pseudomonadota bacterium]
MSKTIFILGGYGVFGGRLAERLIAQTCHQVIIAGRSAEKAAEFCKRRGGGEPYATDRDDVTSLHRAFAQTAPDIVIDASGPFDFDGTWHCYRVATCAINAGAHYVDLADNADFVSNISMLDELAREAGRIVLSGVSSVPCLSSAVIDELSKDFAEITAINTAIIPGNRAPRGRAVIESILSQVGKPFAQLEGGQWRSRYCWSTLETTTLSLPGQKALARRLISPIEVPDQRLLPARYGSPTVRFSAGLELRMLHLGLWVMACLVRLGLLRSLRPLTALAHRVATWFEPFGTDRGGMVVDVAGVAHDGTVLGRRWTLMAEQGDGPQVPATPARALIDAIVAGTVKAGAAPAVSVLSLGDIEKHFAPYAIRTGVCELGGSHLAHNHTAGRIARAERTDDADIPPAQIIAEL